MAITELISSEYTENSSMIYKPIHTKYAINKHLLYEKNYFEANTVYFLYSPIYIFRLRFSKGVDKHWNTEWTNIYYWLIMLEVKSYNQVSGFCSEFRSITYNTIILHNILTCWVKFSAHKRDLVNVKIYKIGQKVTKLKYLLEIYW